MKDSVTHAHGHWKGHHGIKKANEILKQENWYQQISVDLQIASEIMSRDEIRGYNVDITIGRLSVEWNTLFSINKEYLSRKQEQWFVEAANLVTYKAPVLLWPLGLPCFPILSLTSHEFLSLFFPACFCLADVLTFWQRTWQQRKSKFRSPHPPHQKLSFLLAFQYQSHRHPLIGHLGHVMHLPFSQFLMAVYQGMPSFSKL